MFTLAQVLLVCIYMWIMAYVGWSMQLFAYGVSVLHGAVIGLIMGDVATGLTIGGTMTLMSLGIGGYGGSSVPDYALGTAAGTVFAIATGQGLEVGLAIGIPVATLGTQFDVLAKMSGSFFIHKQMDCVEKHQFKQMGLWVQGWQIFRATLYTLTIFLAMTVGSGLITTLLNAIKKYLIKKQTTSKETNIMKKLISLVLAAVLVLSLAACSSGTQTAPTAAKNEAETTAAAPTEAAKVKPKIGVAIS
ncbi:MAG: PTS sugar transporter subunit IIC, partial [Traorella sp.]